jgi:D-serine deaminase-like pyridoxal phosphate-dependent protein
MSDPWYHVANVDEIDSPALLVFAERVEENIRRMVRYAGGTQRLRPHVKTHKMAEVVRLQMAAGVDKFKCATIAEAEMVAQCGATDVMLAYSLLGPKIGRFVALAKKFPSARFSALADDEAAVRALSNAAATAGVVVDVLLDVDDGMGRTGIAPGLRAEQLYRLMSDLPGIRAGGFHVYDGHIRDRELKQRIASGDAAFAAVADMRQRLVAAGLPVLRVVAGGTPTFPVHSRRPDVECSPGTCIFWDANYGGKFPDLDFLHAAVLLTRVISKPQTGRLCLDLGYKAVSADQPEPRVALFGIDDAKTIVHNEEHLTIETARADDFAVGDALYGIPFHICPTVALHQYAHVIRDGRVVERWNVVARDRKLTV